VMTAISTMKNRPRWIRFMRCLLRFILQTSSLHSLVSRLATECVSDG
jgi:hypothetical protein